MSKLITRLKTMVEGGGRSLGFRPGMAAPKQESMLLMVHLAALDERAVTDVLKSKVDGLIVDERGLEKSKLDLNKAGDSLRGVPAGVFADRVEQQTMADLEKKGIDFAVFSAEAAVLAGLETSVVGRIVKADPSWKDSTLHSLNDLGVDALYLPVALSKGASLSLSAAMEYQRLVNLVRKPALAGIGSDWQEADIKSLWQIGCAAVVVEAGERYPSDRIAVFRSAVDALPPPSKRRKPSERAILPCVEAAAPETEEEEGQ